MLGLSLVVGTLPAVTTVLAVGGIALTVREVWRHVKARRVQA